MPKKSTTRDAKRSDLDASVWQFLGRMSISVDISNLPASLLAGLAGLAFVADEEVFRIGITCAVRTARREAPLLAKPVYRQRLIDRLEEVRRAAEHLHNLLNVMTGRSYRDLISSLVDRAIGSEICKSHETNFASVTYFTPLLRTLAEAAQSAQMSVDRWFGTQRGATGRPRMWSSVDEIYRTS